MQSLSLLSVICYLHHFIVNYSSGSYNRMMLFLSVTQAEQLETKCNYYFQTALFLENTALLGSSVVTFLNR